MHEEDHHGSTEITTSVASAAEDPEAAAAGASLTAMAESPSASAAGATASSVAVVAEAPEAAADEVKVTAADAVPVAALNLDPVAAADGAPFGDAAAENLAAAAEVIVNTAVEAPVADASDAPLLGANDAPVAVAAANPVAAAIAKTKFNENIFIGLVHGTSFKNVDVIVLGRGTGNPCLVQYISKTEETTEYTDYPVSSGKIYTSHVNSLHGYPRFFPTQKVLVVLRDVVVPAEITGLVSFTKKRKNEPCYFQYRVQRVDVGRENLYEDKDIVALHKPGSTVLIHTETSIEIGVIVSTFKKQDPWILVVMVLRGVSDIFKDRDGIDTFEVDSILCEIDSKKTQISKVLLCSLYFIPAFQSDLFITTGSSRVRFKKKRIELCLRDTCGIACFKSNGRIIHGNRTQHVTISIISKFGGSLLYFGTSG
jgi:hypothetical protein